MDLEDASRNNILNPDTNPELAFVFKNTIILEPHFHISGISQNLIDLLYYTHERLVGQCVSVLIKTGDFEILLKERLAKGFFSETPITLFDSQGNEIDVGISGFMSHAVCGVHGIIILKVRNYAEKKTFQEQLQQKKEELDRFIYSTSHDLRGPLATVRGLINLLKIKGYDEEFERLLQLLEAHANKLDERLFRLVYLAEADSMKREPDHVVNFSQIETYLRKVFEKNAFVDFLEFYFISPQISLSGVNEVLLESLLDNLLLFVLALPMNTINARILLGFRIENSALRITMAVQGFEISESMQKGIQQQEFIYTDVSNYPTLINFYAAQKISVQLKAQTTVEFLQAGKYQIKIMVPVSNLTS